MTTLRKTDSVHSFDDDEKKVDISMVENTDAARKDVADFDFECFEGNDAATTAAKNRKLVRLVDFRVLPTLVLLFILNILDRNNIANTKIAGMTEDIGMKGNDYNNIIVFMFLGYVCAQIPAGFVLAKLPAAVFLSGAVICWGTVSMCCGFVHNVPAMTGLRFLIGVTEAPFFPGAILILSSFYTRKELAIRIAIMYSGNSLSNGFGSLLAAGIIKGMDGVGGLRGWRWLFILEGLVTVAVGVAVLFILPSLPSKTKWLSEEQRRLAVWRMTVDGAGEADEGGDQSIKTGIRLVLKDWKIILLIFQQMFISCVQSFSIFFPSIVKSLGYSTNQTLLLSAPPYFFAFICSVACAWSSSKYNERAFHIVVPMLVGAVGNILVIALPLSSKGARFAAMFMMTVGTYCAFNLGFAWIASTIPRPRVKRGAALSLINGLANASHFFTPYMFPSSDAPKYKSGGIALAVFCFATCGTALTIKFTLMHQNRKMERLDAAGETYSGSLEGIPKGYRFAT